MSRMRRVSTHDNENKVSELDMSSWLDKGRPAVQEAFKAALDQIDAVAKAGKLSLEMTPSMPTVIDACVGLIMLSDLDEQNRRTDGLLAELERLKTRVANFDRLEQENKSLRADLQRLREDQALGDNGSFIINDSKTRQSSPERRHPLGELSPNKRPRLRVAQGNDKSGQQPRDAPIDLKKDYDKLAKNYNAALRANQEYRSVLERRKETLKQWGVYGDKLERRVKQLESRLGIHNKPTDTPTAESRRRRPELTADNVRMVEIAEDTLKRPSPDSSFVYNPLQDGRETSVASAVSSRMTPVPPVGPTIRRSVDEDLPDIEPQDEIPGTHDKLLGLPVHPTHQFAMSDVKVKVEPSSDGPVFVEEKQVQQPRKRKHDEVGVPKNNRLQRIKSEHSSSDAEITSSSYHFIPQASFELDEAADDITTPRKRRPLPRSRYDGEDQQHEHEGLPGSTLADNSTSKSRQTPQPVQSASKHAEKHRSSALLETFPAQQRPRKQYGNLDGKYRDDFHLGNGVKDLAEDGDGESSGSSKHPINSGRLEALLNSPCPTGPSMFNRPATLKQHIPRSVAVNGLRKLPSGHKESINRIATAPTANKMSAAASGPYSARTDDAKKESTLRRDTPYARSMARDKTPLRQRPVEELRMEDFKPNPAFNDGYDFVYDEVVRGKARDELPGCVDPNCCGPFFHRKAVEERNKLGSNPVARAQDIKLLEDYLGDDAHLLGSTSRAKKEELWLEAKTWELSNKYARHRHRYVRMGSPPGFWNTDFPCTQERAAEKEEAERMTRALVKDRCLDARRGNGRWLFRDE